MFDSLGPESATAVGQISITLMQQPDISLNSFDKSCLLKREKCDLTTNAHKMATLIRFPVRSLTDDLLIFGQFHEFNYSIHISFNSTDQFHSSFTVGSNLEVEMSKSKVSLHYVISKEKKSFHIIIQSEILQENYVETVQIVSKRDSSIFSETDDLPDGFCDPIVLKPYYAILN